jgi:hypothetical protein
MINMQREIVSSGQRVAEQEGANVFFPIVACRPPDAENVAVRAARRDVTLKETKLK